MSVAIGRDDHPLGYLSGPVLVLVRVAKRKDQYTMWRSTSARWVLGGSHRSQAPASSDRSAPLRCQRRRVPDRGCCESNLFDLVTSCLSEVQVRLSRSSEARGGSGAQGGVCRGRIFDALAEEATSAGFMIIGLDPSEACVGRLPPRGAQRVAQGTGNCHTDRADRPWRWSIAADRGGIPVGWTAAGQRARPLLLRQQAVAYEL